MNIINFVTQVQIVEWWFNINYKGGMNREHAHPHSIHSGVYYIKTSDCGNLVFLIQTKRGCNLQDIFNCVMVSFSPLKDSLFIFPSWCPHSVDTNLSDEPRISLSFNTGQNNEDTSLYFATPIYRSIVKSDLENYVIDMSENEKSVRCPTQNLDITQDQRNLSYFGHRLKKR